jgi:cytochrome c-type biogenesis protein CcmH/NrfG
MGFVWVFAAGFLVGILFSAWKLESVQSKPTPPVTKQQESPHGQQDNKLEAIQRALAANPQDAEALVALGNHYFDTGNFAKAIEAYNRSLSVQPKNPDVITDMAIAYRKMGQSQQAVDTFRKALEVDSTHAMALFNLGIVLRDDLKDYPEALKALETFLKVAPDSQFGVMIKPWIKKLKDQIEAGEKK